MQQRILCSICSRQLHMNRAGNPRKKAEIKPDLMRYLGYLQQNVRTKKNNAPRSLCLFILGIPFQFYQSIRITFFLSLRYINTVNFKLLNHQCMLPVSFLIVLSFTDLVKLKNSEATNSLSQCHIRSKILISFKKNRQKATSPTYFSNLRMYWHITLLGGTPYVLTNRHPSSAVFTNDCPTL